MLTDASLADCIEQARRPCREPHDRQLREVLPGVVERHGVAITRMMLASTVVGEAAASVIIRDLLKHDDLVKLPPAEPRPITPAQRRSMRPPSVRRSRPSARGRKRKQAAAHAEPRAIRRARHRT